MLHREALLVLLALAAGPHVGLGLAPAIGSARHYHQHYHHHRHHHRTISRRGVATYGRGKGLSELAGGDSPSRSRSSSLGRESVAPPTPFAADLEECPITPVSFACHRHRRGAASTPLARHAIVTPAPRPRLTGPIPVPFEREQPRPRHRHISQTVPLNDSHMASFGDDP